MKNMPRTDQTETKPEVPPADPKTTKYVALKEMLANCRYIATSPALQKIKGMLRHSFLMKAALIVAVLSIIAVWCIGRESREDKQDKTEMSHRRTAQNPNSLHQPEKLFRDAMYHLYGHGGPNRSEYRSSSAYDKMEKAAAAGYVPAQYVHGWLLLYGKHASKVEGIKWLKKAAEHGHVYAQEVLGMAYLKGYGTSADKDKAIMWLKKAAEQKNLEASFQLLELYTHNESVGMSENEVVNMVVNLYDYGFITDDKDILNLLQKGKKLPSGLSDALLWVGDEAYMRKNHPEEWSVVKKLAEEGNAWGQYLYGAGLDDLKPYFDTDKECLTYLEKAVEQGHGFAMAKLIRIYQRDAAGNSKAGAMYQKLLDLLPASAEEQDSAWKCWGGAPVKDDDE